MISIKNVSKYYGENRVLDNVSLEIPYQNVYAIIGPSGAGKSTLIRTINALEKIQEGEIIVDGVSINDSKTDINKVRENIGFVFQSFNLYSHLTALGNVTLALVNVKKMDKKEAEEKGKKILKSLGLEDQCNYQGANNKELPLQERWQWILRLCYLMNLLQLWTQK